MTELNTGPYALYRYFDAGDRLLYVGISGNLAVRDSTHIARSKWMPFMARSTVERRRTLEDVKAAERTAIETEHPLFNVQYNDTPEARERLRAYLEGVGRLDLCSARILRSAISAPPSFSRPVPPEGAIPASEVRQKWSKIMDRAHEGDVIHVTLSGRPYVVLVSGDYYVRAEATIQELAAIRGRMT